MKHDAISCRRNRILGLEMRITDLDRKAYVYLQESGRAEARSSKWWQGYYAGKLEEVWRLRSLSQGERAKLLRETRGHEERVKREEGLGNAKG